MSARCGRAFSSSRGINGTCPSRPPARYVLPANPPEASQSVTQARAFEHGRSQAQVDGFSPVDWR